MPVIGHAQNRPQQGGPGGGGGGGAQVGPLIQVIKELDLTDDQQASVKQIVQQTQSDLRDAMSGMQGAAPEERQQKMQDMQKIVSDSRGKLEAILTPEQKAKYYPLMAKAIVTQAQQRLTMVKTAVGKQDLSDDEKGQMNKLLDGDQKTLDGLTADAQNVKDADGLAEVQKKEESMQQETRRQIVEILGPDGARQLLQAMRPGARRPAAEGAAQQDAPTTKPAKD
jgi:Spy/CpxP family protein refolding chaperone